MDGWHELGNILILLAAALVLGTLAEQLKQSAIVGYILAGALVGPNAMGLVSTPGEVQLLTEMGVSLLLFTIGLEFSVGKLARLGAATAGAGALQIAVTWAAAAGICLALGMDVKASLVIGAAASLSSTAGVLRLFSDYTMMDSMHGRAATGILLLQDAAVVPLVLLVSAMAGASSAGEILAQLGRAGLMSAAAFAALFVVLNYIVPRILNLRTWAKNRELPILLAVAVAVGSALLAHEAGISPAFGAFLAGMLLAESPFATQIRADVGAIRAVMVTLFFAAAGMAADPRWIGGNLPLVLAASAGVIVLKTALTSSIMLLLRFRPAVAVPAGASISQVGEFSFVLAGMAAGTGILTDMDYRLVVSVTIVTLVVTPYLVGAAPRLVRLLGESAPRAGKDKDSCRVDEASPVIVIGFGPAGRRVVENLSGDFAPRIVVLDVNPRNAAAAKEFGVEFHVGDAKNAEVLEHAGARCAAVIVVTLPDPEAARRIILLCRDMAPNARVAARARYDIYAGDIKAAGAEAVVNEEVTVGLHLAQEARKIIG